MAIVSLTRICISWLGDTRCSQIFLCILNTLLYDSESWTSYARQENRLESFHLRCLHRILGITWQDKVTNTAVLGVLALTAYTSSSVSAGRAGSATCIAWAMAASQKMCCMGSWQQDTVPQAAWQCISRMSASAILNLQTLTQASGSR